MAKVTNSSYLTKRRRYKIQATIHEEALAVSGESSYQDLQIEAVKQIIMEEFNAMDAWIDQRGGIIGHIKGFVATPEKSLMISATGAELGCRFLEIEGRLFDGVQVSLAWIVFNIPQLELEKKLIEIFDKLNNERKELVIGE